MFVSALVGPVVNIAPSVISVVKVVAAVQARRTLSASSAGSSSSFPIRATGVVKRNRSWAAATAGSHAGPAATVAGHDAHACKATTDTGAAPPPRNAAIPPAPSPGRTPCPLPPCTPAALSPPMRPAFHALQPALVDPSQLPPGATDRACSHDTTGSIKPSRSSTSPQDPPGPRRVIQLSNNGRPQRPQPRLPRTASVPTAIPRVHPPPIASDAQQTGRAGPR